MLKFIVVFLAAVLIISVAAIAWGRFTTAPKPQALQVVEGAMTKTPVGQAIAQVLGVAGTEPVEPINLPDAALSVVGSVAGAITNRVETAVASQALVAVANQYDQLPQDQRTILQTIVCKPPEQ